MNNIIKLTCWDTSPSCWHNFVEYVRQNSNMLEWETSEGGEGSYSYTQLQKILQQECNCSMNYIEHGAELVFETENHKLLFELKYS